MTYNTTLLYFAYGCRTNFGSLFKGKPTCTYSDELTRLIRQVQEPLKVADVFILKVMQKAHVLSLCITIELH